MIAFYEYYLISGTNAFASALQQAKLQLIEDGEYSHPFFLVAFYFDREMRGYGLWVMSYGFMVNL